MNASNTSSTTSDKCYICGEEATVGLIGNVNGQIVGYDFCDSCHIANIRKNHQYIYKFLEKENVNDTSNEVLETDINSD